MILKNICKYLFTKESFKVLNINKNATEQDIKLAYNQLIKKYHPDVYTGNKEIFINIKKAYNDIKQNNYKYIDNSTSNNIINNKDINYNDAKYQNYCNSNFNNNSKVIINIYIKYIE